MSRIKFTVEDSKVSEVLKLLLNSEIDINELEVSGSEPNGVIQIHHIDDKDNNQYTYKYTYKKYTPVGVDPSYVKIGDEGFDYQGSTGGSDKIYKYQSTTDKSSYNPTASTQSELDF